MRFEKYIQIIYQNNGTNSGDGLPTSKEEKMFASIYSLLLRNSSNKSLLMENKEAIV